MTEWKTTRVSEFLKERKGRYKPTDPAVLGLKRLSKIDFSGKIHLSDKNSKTNMIIIEPEDLVISGINVSKGAIAVYHGKNPLTATIHYSSYEFDEDKIEIEYFKRFLKSQSFVQSLKEQVKGGIKTKIKPKHFLPLNICLPDIDSQKEIVAFFNRVEDNMAELSTEIEHQQGYLKKLRQQILQEAIEGKLTVEWRKKNPKLINGDNHASKLLEKIKAEKERLIREKKIGKQKPFVLITNDEKPFGLPKGWVWCRIGQIGTVNRGKSPIYDKQGIKQIINQKCVRWFHVDIQHCKPISFNWFATLSKEMQTEINDVLVNSTGEGTIGRSAIVNEKSAGLLFDSHVLRIKLHIEFKYIVFLINSAFGQNQIDKLKGAKSTKQTELGVNNLTNLMFPLPPLSEQKSIVQRINKLMSMIDELEKQVSERKEQSLMLMQSVLKEAFEN